MLLERDTQRHRDICFNSESIQKFCLPSLAQASLQHSRFALAWRMAEPAVLRKACVQQLRKAAKQCDVPLIRDTAARDKVQEFAQAIQEKRFL